MEKDKFQKAIELEQKPSNHTHHHIFFMMSMFLCMSGKITSKLVIEL